MKKTIQNLLTNGQKLYLPLDGKFTDQSGNGVTITQGSGMTFVTDPWGQPNGACRFPDANSYLQFPRPFDAQVNTSERYTVSFWVKSTAVFTTNRYLNHSTYNNINLEYGSTNRGLVYENNEYYTYSSVAVSDGTWKHIVIVGDYANGKRLDWYINGVLRNGYAPRSVDPYNLASTWTLQPNYEFDTCDFRVYDRAWTTEEVAMYYSYANHNIERGLVRYYKLQNSSDTTDYTGLSSGAYFDNIVYDSEGIDGRKNKGVHIRSNASDTVPSSFVIPSLSFTDTQPHSFSIWVKYDGRSSDIRNQYIVPFGNGAGVYYAWSVVGSYFYLRNGSGSYTNYHDISYITDGNWHHLVMTMDQTRNLTLYVDNIVKGSPISVTDSSVVFYTIGQGYGWGSAHQYCYNAHYSEARFYNRALYPSEVQELYGQFRYLNDVNLPKIYKDIKSNIRYFCDFSNISGSNLYDQTDYKIAGTITGATATTNGLIFDGNDYVQLPMLLNPNETFTNITAMVWFKTGSNITNHQEIFTNWSSPEGLLLGVLQSKLRSYYAGDRLSAEVLEPNKNYFAVQSTYIHSTEGYIKISINGKSYETVYSGNTTSLQPRSNNLYNIGRADGGEYFGGTINFVALLDRELSEQEINKFYRYTRLAFPNTPNNLITPISNNITVTENSDVSEGLALYLPMNEGSGTTLTDYSGNGFDYVATGLTWGVNQNNIPNRGLYFAGSAGHYLSRNSVWSTSGSLTYSAWVNIDSDIGDGIYSIFDQGYGGWGSGAMLGIQNKLLFMNWVDSVGGLYNTAHTISLGSWVYVAGSVDVTNNIIRSYINGVMQLNSVNPRDIIDDTRVAYTGIGVWSANNDWYFKGSIADARVYNRALSETEVLRIYNATKPNYI